MPSTEQLSPLNPEASAHLVESVGAPEFGPALLDIAHAAAQAVELFAYLVREGMEPDVLVSQSRLDGAEARVADYVERFYRHDPAVERIWQAAPGESFMQRIAPQSIIPHDYRRRCFREPGFTEKLSFGWRGTDYIVVLSFYRAQSDQSATLGRLASLASLALAILVRHHAPVGHGDAVQVIERRLRNAYPGLSAREVEVCTRTLLGWSAARIGNAMRISAGTVLTYRRRAYDKTGHSSIGEFVPAVLR